MFKYCCRNTVRAAYFMATVRATCLWATSAMKMSFLLSGTSPNRSFFHLNISSFIFRFDKLIVLMIENKLNFDFLRFSETCLELNRNSLKTLSMPGYNIEHTPAEFSNSGTLLYIKQKINYKLMISLPSKTLNIQCFFRLS